MPFNVISVALLPYFEIKLLLCLSHKMVIYYIITIKSRAKYVNIVNNVDFRVFISYNCFCIKSPRLSHLSSDLQITYDNKKTYSNKESSVFKSTLQYHVSKTYELIYRKRYSELNYNFSSLCSVSDLNIVINILIDL